MGARKAKSYFTSRKATRWIAEWVGAFKSAVVDVVYIKNQGFLSVDGIGIGSGSSIDAVKIRFIIDHYLTTLLTPNHCRVGKRGTNIHITKRNGIAQCELTRGIGKFQKAKGGITTNLCA